MLLIPSKTISSMRFGDISIFRLEASSLGEIVALGFFSLAGGLITQINQSFVLKRNLNHKVLFLVE